MEVIRGTEGLSGRFRYPVVALGNFDGVHVGHHALIRKVVERAGEMGGESIAVTFDPHPLKVLAPEKAPPLLTTLKTKLSVLEDLGVQKVICISFTRAFSQQGPEDFIEETLFRGIGAKEVVVGHNYAFGKGRKGNVSHLMEMGERLGFRVWVVDPVKIEGVGVSSSSIRDYLKAGDLEHANSFLGRDYLVEGVVSPGHRRGAELGFPTANLSLIAEMLPRSGVYAVRVAHGFSLMDGICYVGSQPTFQGQETGLEVHLLDFSGELYQESLRVYFVAWLREEKAFKGREELVSQIRKDLQRAREFLHPSQGRMVNVSKRHS
jgi:riboflavin kinase/FMN adenylyltransferase